LKSESNNSNRHSSFPSFSIVIEWENILLSEKWRTVEMLRQLSKQIVEISPNLSSKPEVIIVYDSDNFEHCQVEQFVNQQLEPCSSMIDLRIIPAAKLRYYELKNYGVQQSHQDIIILLDSDIIPKEGWLVAMLEPFQNPGTSILTALHSYPKSLCEKAFSVIWNWNFKSENGDQIYEIDRFSCHNAAFRREILEANPFPPLPQFRGSCAVLGDRLRLQGYKILCQPKSRYSHPAPNGLRHFVVRALCQGHDIAIASRRARKMNEASMAFDRLDNRWTLGQIFSYIRQKYRSLRLNPKDTFSTLAIVFTYLLFVYIGIQVSNVKPELIYRHLSI